MTRFFLLAILSALAAYGQSTAGRFSGTVTDASTSLVPGVKVSAVNVETGQTVTENTNGQGQFVLYPLPPGVYNITLEKAGFSRYTIDGVRIEVSSSLTRNVALEVGATGQSVTVSAD